MPRLLSITVTLLLLCTVLGCRGDLGMRGDLQARYATIDKAIYDKDISAYSAVLTKDFKYVDLSGKSFSKVDVLENTKKSFQMDWQQPYTVLDDVKSVGDHLETTVTWNGKFKRKAATGKTDDVQIRDFLRDIWQREDGQWKVGTSTVMSHDEWINGKFVGGVPSKPL